MKKMKKMTCASLKWDDERMKINLLNLRQFGIKENCFIAASRRRKNMKK
jgi:hypothetical protein